MPTDSNNTNMHIHILSRDVFDECYKTDGDQIQVHFSYIAIRVVLIANSSIHQYVIKYICTCVVLIDLNIKQAYCFHISYITAHALYDH